MRKRLGVTFAAAVGVVIVLAAPALAHVTIDPSTAPKGSFARLVFSVPNELAPASIVTFSVKFDANHPIAVVKVKPMPGWTPTVTMTSVGAPLQTEHGQVTEIVSAISWSGSTIAPNQFEEFEVSAGPLPSDVDHLAFDAVQTYSDGTTVQWTQQSFAGQPAADHPAPVIELTSVAGPATPAKSSSGPDYLAIAALVIGAAALGLAFWVWSNVRHWR